MNRVGLLCLFIGLLAITCVNADQKPGGGGGYGGGGKCKDKYDEEKCIKIKEAGKCEDKVAKKCMKTCEKCEDGGGEGGKCKDKLDYKKCKKKSWRLVNARMRNLLRNARRLAICAKM